LLMLELHLLHLLLIRILLLPPGLDLADRCTLCSREGEIQPGDRGVSSSREVVTRVQLSRDQR
jgi:hypothetical protein